MCARENKKKTERGSYHPTLQSILDIWNVLAAHAAPDHPLTAGEISKYLNQNREESHASAQTVSRLLLGATDVINTVSPHTVLREEGRPAILHTYPWENALHVVVETPNGESLWEGKMTAVFREGGHDPVPYSTLTRLLPQLMDTYDGKKSGPEKSQAAEKYKKINKREETRQVSGLPGLFCCWGTHRWGREVVSSTGRSDRDIPWFF